MHFLVVPLRREMVFFSFFDREVQILSNVQLLTYYGILTSFSVYMALRFPVSKCSVFYGQLSISILSHNPLTTFLESKVLEN